MTTRAATHPLPPLLGLCLLASAVPSASAADAPAAPAAKPADPKAAEFFESKVRPVLVARCFECHAGKAKKGGLKLDSLDAALKGGLGGPAVVPGDPDKSELVKVVRYDGDMKMPPKGKLPDAEIAALTAWVKMGAPWPGASPASAPPAAGKGMVFTDEQRRHWAWQPVRDHAPPAVRDTLWPAGDLDRFILAGLEAKGLRPAAPADRRTLVRRATFDLTGLPPTPEEVEAFVADPDGDAAAFAKVVDRLLASPAYGERWGRFWLDVARYADSNGLDENTAFANAWRYRDYVIAAFNSDKPYDRFVVEQLAGDKLPPSPDEAVNHERLVATGFLGLGPKLLAEPDKQKMVMDIVDEQIDTMGKTFLALTLGCSRCHDHKFDPVPTRDYYALAGIFKSTKTMATLATVARVLERPLGDKAAQDKAAEHEKALAAKTAALRSAEDAAMRELAAALRGDAAKYLLAAEELTGHPDVHPSVAPLMAGPFASRPGVIVLEAERFARGDVKVSMTGYGEGVGIIESAGRTAAFTEYEVEVPKAGHYQIEIRYAAAESRPVRLSLDGKVIRPEAAKSVTGGWGPAQQGWGVEGVHEIAAGKHVLRVDQIGAALPHIEKIALVPLDGAPTEKPIPSAKTNAKADGNADAKADPKAPKQPAGDPKPADINAAAARHSLNAEVLKNWAALLNKSRRVGAAADPVLGPWHALADLPAEGFAEAAAKLVGGWKADKKTPYAAPVIAALAEGGPPKTLPEAADRYAKLIQSVGAEFDALPEKARKSKDGKDRPDAKLPDAAKEVVRKAVLDPAKGPFAVAKPEALYPLVTAAKLKALKLDLEAAKKLAPPPVPVAIAVQDEDKPADVKVHLRGNHLTLGEEAPRRFLRIIEGEAAHVAPPPRFEGSGRLELARWIASPDHPLTARVMVNRIWQGHFGEGIVRSPDNFGKLGERPTHPELLDWLARRFVESGWSVKAMHRLMMNSAAYRMSSRTADSGLRTADSRSASNAQSEIPNPQLIDPDNRLLWRFNRRRLEVEAIRDAVLAVAGTLDRTMGGTLLETKGFDYVTNDQSRDKARYDVPRRSIYLPVIRNSVYSVFQVFDFVEPSVPNGKRSGTTVAPQALFLMNGRLIMEQSEALAKRLLADTAADDAARVRRMWLSCNARPPSDPETASALAFVKAFAARLAESGAEKDEDKRTLTAWQALAQVAFAGSEFVYLE